MQEMMGLCPRIQEGSDCSTRMQANRIAIITGVCVGGIAVALIAVAISARRKIRTDPYAYSAPGTTAAFTEYTNTISGTITRALSGGGGSPTAVSPASASSTPHYSPHGPPTYFEVDSPPAGSSAAGGNNNPQTVVFGETGPSSTSGAPASTSATGQRITAAGGDGSGAVALDARDLDEGNPFPDIPETSTL